MNAMVHHHEFELAGLGSAPFHVAGYIDNGKVATSCDFCGTGIRHEFLIKSADGRVFSVGNECVQKSDDSGLISEAKRAKREWRREMERKRCMEMAAAAEREREARENAERLANGGYTNDELEKMESLARRQVVQECNRFAVNMLHSRRNENSDFCQSIAYSLMRGSPIWECSERVREILGEIWAREQGLTKRQIELFDQARAEFAERVDRARSLYESWVWSGPE